MKLFITILIALFTLTACNSFEVETGTGQDNLNKKEKDTRVDSLEKQVDEDHIIGMSKMARVSRAQSLLLEARDSILKLPAKARMASKEFMFRADSLIDRLKYAEYAMDKWMEDYSRNMDSAKNDAEKRIEFLTKEKLKVSKVKDAILSSLAKADSLLKAKF